MRLHGLRNGSRHGDKDANRGKPFVSPSKTSRGLWKQKGLKENPGRLIQDEGKESLRRNRANGEWMEQT